MNSKIAAGLTGCCLRVCLEIAQQLVVAKHNKSECKSLGTAISCIEGFLRNIPEDGVSPVGSKVLEALLEELTKAQALLTRVCNTGPLVSLITASVIREEFLRINRDLTNTFQILAAGENLLDLTEARSELVQIQRQLSRTKTFFVEYEQNGDRLKEIAAVALLQSTPDQLLHQALLEQLEQYSQLADLSPDELLEELQTLQLAALYGGGGLDGLEQSEGAGDGAIAGKGKAFGADTEEFLVQQLCAALAPRAASAGGTLIPAAAPEVPDGYTCPISQEVMVNPVILAETGHSYESANIQRWLASHNTCPATGKALSTKLLIPNHNLKKSIQSWAQQHGLALPAANILAGSAASLRGTTAPEHVSLLIREASSRTQLRSTGGQVGSTSAQMEAPTAVMMLDSAAALDTCGSEQPVAVSAASRTLSSRAAAAAAEQGDTEFAATRNATVSLAKDASIGLMANSSSRCRCTRTAWAVGLAIVIVAVAVGAGAGVGIFLARRPVANQVSASAGAAGTSSSSVQPATAAANTTTTPASPTPSPVPAQVTLRSPILLSPAIAGSPSPAPDGCPDAVTLNVTGSNNSERGAVWGSGPYTNDSDFNVAAVHAGLVSVGQPATILLKPAGKMSNYTGSTANGVTTRDYGNDWCAVDIELAGG